ncbi:MAG: CHAT domain-containing protein [Alkalinema sp. RU_4_3]|nr:CHAT domain-containing protein [Alkalinema sp. RU_4_3]
MPQLLAGGQGIQHAPELVVSATGDVALKGSGVTVGSVPGTAVLSGSVAGDLAVRADGQLTVYSGNIVGFDLGGGSPVVLEAGEKVLAGSRIQTAGRSIEVRSPLIEVKEISTAGAFLRDGRIRLTGLDGVLAESVKTGSLFTAGQGVEILGKSVDTGFIISAIGPKTSQGEIRVVGRDRLETGGVLSYGQNLRLESAMGLLKSGVIVTYGGDVSLKGDRVDASFVWTTPELVGKAGNVVIESQGDLRVRQVEAIGKGNGEGGNVRIASENGDTSVSSIQAYGQAIGGGNVFVKGDRVQVTGIAESVLADGSKLNSSIRADGTVEIEHGGGKRNLPFAIGDKFYNGTAGAIVSGNTVMSQGRFRVGRSDRVEQGGGVTVTARNRAPRFPEEGKQVFQKSVARGEAVGFSLFELGVGEPIDPENDQTQIYLRLKNPSGRSGRIVDQFGRIVDGTRPVGLNDRLTYLAPEKGGIVADGFELIVVDVPLEEGEDAFAGAVGRFGSLELVFNSRNVIPLVEPAMLEAETSKAGPTTGTSGLSDVSPADVAALDKGLSKEYTDAGIGGDVAQTTENPLDLVKRIQLESGVRSALVYLTLPPGDSRPLEVTLVTAKGAFRKRLTAPQWEILQQAAVFRSEVTNPLRTGTKSYLASARKLHRWIIDPLRNELTQQGVRNLVFLPQGGLRSIPFAALHDGNRFLVEEFGVGMMPSVSLTQTKYQNVKEAAVFAAGISEAVGGQVALPMVKGEIGAIAQLWPRSSTVLNEKTTLGRLEGARKENPFRIVHLATHANFTAGNPKAAYIQLWDQRLQLEQLKKLNWNDPPVELLVLSACRTARGG